MLVEAVVLDLDGVIIESEALWEDARCRFAALHGKTWTHTMNAGIIAMGPQPSSKFIRDQLGLDLSLATIQEEVVNQLLALYDSELPIVSGAPEVVKILGATWPLGLASSASRRVIDHVLMLSGLGDYLRVSVSSEEVKSGKPAPDIYLKACSLLGVRPLAAVAIEDSNSGIESALAAGMTVIAIIGSAYPPSVANRQRAAACLPSLAQVTQEIVKNSLLDMP